MVCARRSLGLYALLPLLALGLAGCIDNDLPPPLEADATGLRVPGLGALLLPLASVSDVARAHATSWGARQSQTSDVAAVDLGDTTLAGASAEATADGAVDAGADAAAAPEARASAVVRGVSLLGGLVTAAEVAVGARSSHGVVGTEGSRVVGLRVAGQEVPEPIPPGTTLSLPGVATVVVLETTREGNQVTVEGLRVSVIGAGSIVVGIASARADRLPYPQHHCTTGVAEAMVVPDRLAGLDGDATPSRIAARAEGLEGTGDASGHALGGAGGLVAFARTAGAHVRLGVDPHGARGEADAAALQLGIPLYGIRAEALHLRAAGWSGPGAPHGTLQATFTGLQVGGVRVPDLVPPNTRIGPLRAGDAGEVVVTLNAQEVSIDPDAGTVTVAGAAIHVVGHVDGAAVDLRVVAVGLRFASCT